MYHDSDSLDAASWQPLLTTRLLGRGENACLLETDSTNLRLRLMAQAGAPHGSLCLCEQQTAGRGRLGRSWHSPAGQGLWLSVLLRPKLPMDKAPLITFCAALAMARAVREVTGLDAQIKWPNDLVCGGKKLCGILLEMGTVSDTEYFVVTGTGLNVRRGAYPPELTGQAASLEDFTPPPPRRELLAAYLAALEEAVSRLESDGFDGILPALRSLCCTLGSRVHVSGAVTLTGTAEDLDASGALMVRTDDGQLHRVLSGDVSVRGVMGYV